MNMIKLLADVDMNSVMNNGMSFPERLRDGGQMILIVMAFVFSVIFIIWLAQTIISLAVNKLLVCKIEKKEKSAPDTASAPVAAPAPVNVSPVASDDGMTVAVITAALSAYLSSTSADGKVLPFRVVSFKRKNSGKPWNS